MDITTFICFGNSVDAIHASDFKAPVLVAMVSCAHRYTLTVLDHKSRDILGRGEGTLRDLLGFTICDSIQFVY